MNARSLLSLIVFAALVVGLLGSAAAFGQDSLTPDEILDGGLVIDSVDASQYPTVAVIASIPQQQIGDGVPDLEIQENGRPVSATVALEASDGLEIVLLLDVSGSMKGEPLAAAQDSAKQFIAAMPDTVDMAVIAFGSNANLVAEFSSDKDYLTASIDDLFTRGETALYDGLIAAADVLRSSEDARRTIVVVSDGGDTVSSSSLEEAVAELVALDVDLYSIELQSPENDRLALDTLAAATGGSVFSAEEADLGAVFDSIAAQLLTRFRVTYQAVVEGEAEIKLSLLTNTGVVSADQAVTFPTSATAESLIEVPPSITAPPIPPVLRPGQLASIGWWESETALWIGIAAVFLALVTTLVMSTMPRPNENMLRADPRRVAEIRPTALSALANSATNLAETTLASSDRLTPMNAALERAGLAIRPAEFVVLTVSGALAGAALGFFLAGPAAGLMLAAVVVVFVKFRISSLTSKRSSQFAGQLSDTLQLMASSLRAGYGLLQAVDAVATEAPAPASEEFQRIKVETQLGREVEDAMKAASVRVQSEDFQWVAESIEIHRQIGGDLAEILDAVNETIRDRNRIRRRIRALSAEGRISGIVLSLIPAVLVIVIALLNPAYLLELTDTTVGRFLIFAGLGAWLVAVVWMRRLVRLVF